MSDNKKYYYLKLKDNFFDSDELKILEGLQNGYLYSNLLLKLYLKSLKSNGSLRLNEYIPYDNEMISAITGINIDTVKVAMDLFKSLKLIEILNDGTIYLLNVQQFIGKSSTEADRIRNYRNSIEQIKLDESTQFVQLPYKCTPEIEIEIELELDTDLKKDKNKNIMYETIFQEYQNANLVKHTKFTPDMKKAIDLAKKQLGLSEQDFINIIKRHKQKYELTKGSQYPIRKRTLSELFGQKKNGGVSLICSDYLDDVWEPIKSEPNHKNEVIKDGVKFEGGLRVYE